MGRWPVRGLLLQTLLWWTLVELGYAGTRPHQRWQRPRLTRQPYGRNDRTQNPTGYDRGSQRIEYPSVNDDQTVLYPLLYDRGQKVVYPSLNDNGGSGQSQVNTHDGSGVWLGERNDRAVNDSPHGSGSSGSKSSHVVQKLGDELISLLMKRKQNLNVRVESPSLRVSDVSVGETPPV